MGTRSAVAAAPAVTTAVRPVPPRSPRKRWEPQLGDRIRLGVLTEEITPEAVDEVLESTGRASAAAGFSRPARWSASFWLSACSAAPAAKDRLGYRAVLRTLEEDCFSLAP
ncbi:hypothetical protein ACR6C2_43395 [Streptomyces sp. INA 01156]